MPDTYILFALASTVGVGVVLNVMNIVGASLYDIKQITKQRLRLRHPYAKRYRHKPLITIIIPGYNNADGVELTLNSILKSSYRTYEVIIVNNASTDGTKKIVQEFIKSHKRLRMQLMSLRKRLGRGGAVNAGFKKYANGELIMVLDSGSVLDRHALRNIAHHFAANDIGILIPHVRFLEHPSIISLIQRFNQMAKLRARKFNSLVNAEWDASSSGVVYRRALFKELKGLKEYLLAPDIDLGLKAARMGDKNYRSYYAGDMVVYAEPVTSCMELLAARYRQKLGKWQAMYANKSLFFSPMKGVSRPLAWFRLPLVIWEELMVMAEPLIVAYFVYLAISFKQPVPAAIGWALISFLFGFSLWTDNQLPVRKKLKLTAYIPIMYPLVLVMTFIDTLAIIAGIASLRKIAPKKPTKPKRLSANKTSAPKKPSRSRQKPVKKLAPQT